MQAVQLHLMEDVLGHIKDKKCLGGFSGDLPGVPVRPGPLLPCDGCDEKEGAVAAVGTDFGKAFRLPLPTSIPGST